jgi:hypothetical protein
MATPDLANIGSIIPGQVNVGLSTSTIVGILTNSAGSNTALKIDNIRVSNTNSVIEGDISIGICPVGSAVTDYLMFETTVPLNTALVVANKDSGVYLLENTHLVAVASSENVLNVSVKYETLAE